MKLTAHEVAHLSAVEITAEERKAILAVLYSGLSVEALRAIGLYDLEHRLRDGCYDGQWDFNGLPKVPQLKDYGIARNQIISKELTA